MPSIADGNTDHPRWKDGSAGEFSTFSVSCQTFSGSVRHSLWSGESYLYSRSHCTSLGVLESLFSIGVVIVCRVWGPSICCLPRNCSSFAIGHNFKSDGTGFVTKVSILVDYINSKAIYALIHRSITKISTTINAYLCINIFISKMRNSVDPIRKVSVRSWNTCWYCMLTINEDHIFKNLFLSEPEIFKFIWNINKNWQNNDKKAKQESTLVVPEFHSIYRQTAGHLSEINYILSRIYILILCNESS